jgi:hypothetical protein
MVDYNALALGTNVSAMSPSSDGGAAGPGIMAQPGSLLDAHIPEKDDRTPSK